MCPTLTVMFQRRVLGLVAMGTLVLASCSSDGTTVERSAAPASTSTTSAPETTTSTAPTTTAAPTTSTIAAPAVENASAATSPGELASRLAAAETTVRDPATSPDDLSTAAFEQQLLYRQLGRTPEWEADVLAALPDHLRHAAWANAAARREFRSMHRNLSDMLPAWRIVDPVAADELLAHYREGEATFGVPWHVLAAVNLVETGMGRIRGTSVAGAQGPMQFMPATWAAFGDGGDINDTRDAIMGAARYLAHNGGGAGDIDNALWNYNHSDRYVQGVKLYSSIMAQEPQTFYGYHQWQIVYLSAMGDILLPTGYETHERVPVADHVTRNPNHHLGTATS